MTQVLVRVPELHGRISRMVKADVISSTGDKIKVKIGASIRELPKSQTVPLAGPGQSQIVSQPTPARNAFARNF